MNSASKTALQHTVSGPDFLGAAFEIAPFAFVGHELERTHIALGRFVASAHAAQQIGPRGMEEVVLVQIAATVERINKAATPTIDEYKASRVFTSLRASATTTGGVKLFPCIQDLASTGIK